MLIVGLFLAILLSAGSGTGLAQDAQIPLEAQIQRLEASVSTADGLSEEERAALQATVDDIKASRERASEFNAQIGPLSDIIETGAEQLASLQAEIVELQESPRSLSPTLVSSGDIAALESEIDQLESQRSAWTRERKRELDASANASRLDAERRARLVDITNALQQTYAVVPDEDAPALENQIAEVAAAARREALQAEEAMQQLALRAAPQVNALRAVRIAWLDASISEADMLLAELQALMVEQRGDEAQERLEALRDIVAPLADDLPPAHQELLDLNTASIRTYQELATQIEQTRNTTAALRAGGEKVDQSASLTRRRLEVAGLESELGDVMLLRLGSLPDTARLSADRRDRNGRIAALSLNAIDTEQALRELDSEASRRDDNIDTQTGALRSALQALRSMRRELLQSTLQAQNRLVLLLVEANQESAELEMLADNYRDLLTANLLWVRNYEPLMPTALKNQLAEIRKTFTEWRTARLRPAKLVDGLFLLGLVASVLVVFQRRKVAGKLKDLLGQPIRPRDESHGLVFRALGLTVLAVLPIPLVMATLGYGLALLSPGSVFAEGLRACLWAAALILGVVGFVGRMGGKLGAGRRVLKWNSLKVDAITRDLAWGRLLLATSVVAFVLGHSLSPALGGGSLAIGGSALATVTLIFMVARMLASGAFAGDAFARVGLRIAGVALAVIAVIHVNGQFFAAHQYLWATVLSMLAVLVVLLAGNVLQRILLIQRATVERKVRAEQKARELSVEDGTEQSNDVDGDRGASTSLSDAYERLLSLFRFLSLGACLWYIWSPALPALAFLDVVTLWTTVDPSVEGSGLHVVSLSVLLLAILVLAVTFLLTRHVPPLISVLLLEWSSVSGGSRYATGMIMQYVIIGVGMSVALGMLGFQWSKVQWLVAALGVGIGFGLQEIVANFISGIIVLFERPIRVGDIINAGGHDGTVTKINARATVIQTFERKEVMIPNKELITSVVTNWSLSNTQLRVLIPVGVAYGADVRLAMRLLIEVARANPNVLTDPEPLVTFEDFGDNALVLWLRCYASADYVQVATALRAEIYDQLNAADIGIAFPQRDVHLDAQSPIPVRLMAEEATEANQEG